MSCRRRERNGGTIGQLFIGRRVEPFQLRWRQASFEARIGGIAWLHAGNFGF